MLRSLGLALVFLALICCQNETPSPQIPEVLDFRDTLVGRYEGSYAYYCYGPCRDSLGGCLEPLYVTNDTFLVVDYGDSDSTILLDTLSYQIDEDKSYNSFVWGTPYRARFSFQGDSLVYRISSGGQACGAHRVFHLEKK